MVKKLNLGIIGFNEGNGHPYSFSAIINGYSPIEMASSPFPTIANYLGKKRKDDFGIEGVKVTHIWTQDIRLSEQVAKASLIDQVIPCYEDLYNQVDAVIIARDDAQSHRKLASFFLEKGIPVLIDKPLCDNLDDLYYFTPFLKNGLLMSCSGLRYHPSILSRCNGELQPSDVIFSQSNSILDWFKYGIHVLEGVTPILGFDIVSVQNIGTLNSHIVKINYASGKYALINLDTQIGFVLSSSFFTTKKHYTINYDDNFSCFKSMLIAFCTQICTAKPAINPEETFMLIKTLIAADYSHKSGGHTIHLKDFS